MTVGKRATTTPVQKRPSIGNMIERQESMLNNALPLNYGAIENVSEALAAIIPPPREITMRMHIVWDNPASNLDLERVLDHMRETGAAMVVKVEEVS